MPTIKSSGFSMNGNCSMNSAISKFIFSIGSVAFCFSAANSALAEGPGWTEFSKLTSYVVVADGGVNVSMSVPLSRCISNSGYGPTYASLYPNHPGFKGIQAGLLAAFLTGRSIRIYLSDDKCRIGEIQVSS